VIDLTVADLFLKLKKMQKNFMIGHWIKNLKFLNLKLLKIKNVIIIFNKHLVGIKSQSLF